MEGPTTVSAAEAMCEVTASREGPDLDTAPKQEERKPFFTGWTFHTKNTKYTFTTLDNRRYLERTLDAGPLYYTTKKQQKRPSTRYNNYATQRDDFEDYQWIDSNDQPRRFPNGPAILLLSGSEALRGLMAKTPPKNCTLLVELETDTLDKCVGQDYDKQGWMRIFTHRAPSRTFSTAPATLTTIWCKDGTGPTPLPPPPPLPHPPSPRPTPSPSSPRNVTHHAIPPVQVPEDNSAIIQTMCDLVRVEIEELRAPSSPSPLRPTLLSALAETLWMSATRRLNSTPVPPTADVQASTYIDLIATTTPSTVDGVDHVQPDVDVAMDRRKRDIIDLLDNALYAAPPMSRPRATPIIPQVNAAITKNWSPLLDDIGEMPRRPLSARPHTFTTGAQIRGRKELVKLLFDTGAGLTAIVKASVLKGTSIKSYPLQQPLYMQYANNMIQAHSHVVSLPLKIQNSYIEITALVVDDCPHDIIIGDAWLADTGAKIDYSNGTINFYIDGKKHTIHGEARKKWPAKNVDLTVQPDAEVSAASETRPEPVDTAFVGQTPKALARAMRAGKVQELAIFTVGDLMAPAPGQEATVVASVAQPSFTDAARERQLAGQHTGEATPSTSSTPVPSVPASADPKAETVEQRTTRLRSAVKDGDDPHLAERMREVILEFPHLFPKKNLSGLPPDRPPVREVIPLQPGAKPVAQRMFRYSPAEMKEMEDTVKDLMERGLIQPSTSPWAAPVVFAFKKDGTRRMCYDYRALNKLTIRNSFPLPRIDDLLDKLQGATVFTSLDLLSGYHQVGLMESDREKTAFRTPTGQYEFKVVPFGLTNAPSVFMETMTRALRGVKNAIVYLDDILIFSKSPEDHPAHLREVLRRLADAQFYCKLNKCEFLKPELTFLGHVVSKEGIKPDPNKVKAIVEWPAPKTVQALRQFLGFAMYVARHLPNFQAIAAPLYDLLKGNVSKKEGRTTDITHLWLEPQQEAFQKTKDLLREATPLALPDPSLPYDVYAYEVHTDASGWATGAVLQQNGRPVAYLSQKLSEPETRYHTTDRELLAVMRALRAWRCYLQGPKFRVYTDHHPLIHLKTQPTLNKRQVRWSEELAGYDYDWSYHPGKTHVADALSRPGGEPPTITCACCQAGMARLSNPYSSTSHMYPQFDPDEFVAVAVMTRAQRAAQQHQDNVPPTTHVPRTRRNGQPIVPQQQEVPTQQRGQQPSAGPMQQDPATTVQQDQDMAMAQESLEFQALADAADVESQCRRGYATDPWFQKPKNVKHFHFSDGLWFRNSAVVVPHNPQLRRELLRLSHDDRHAGHGGVAKTMHLLTRNYWWKGVRGDVEGHVQRCVTCQTTKANNHLPYGRLRPLAVPNNPWDVVTMDFVTGLPTTSEGHDGVMVMTDKLTRMVHFRAITKKGLTAVVVQNIIANDIHRLHGIPIHIICDRDRVFNSDLFQEAGRLLGCKTLMSSAYHPQTDGATERVNRTLEDYLRAFVDIRSGGKDWEEHLPWAEFAFNNSYHTATGATPFQLNCGRDPRSPISYTSTTYGRTNWDAEGLAQRIAESLSVAKACILAAQDRDRHYANLKRKASQVKEGEWVLLSTKNLSKASRLSEADEEIRKKLFPCYIGPFKVLETFPKPDPETPHLPPPEPVAVKLKLPQKFERLHHTFHVSLIRPYKVNPTDVPPEPDWIQGEPWFEVEKILRHYNAAKTGKPRIHYKIRWAGYTSFHDSWEPEAEIRRKAPAVIREYWANNPQEQTGLI